MTMRALVTGRGGWIFDARSPEPLGGEERVIVRPRVVAVDPADATDDVDGVIPGREFAGEVIAGPVPWKAGTRVVAMPFTACGTCGLCRAGLSVHCAAGRQMGTHEIPGCLAERVVVGRMDLVEIPAGVDDASAALGVCVGRALDALRWVGEQSRGLVTMIGDGATALLAAHMLHRTNAQTRLLWRRNSSVDVCERWRLPHRNITEAGRRADQDAVIDACGDETSIAAAVGMLRPRGLLVLADEGCTAPFALRPTAEDSAARRAFSHHLDAATLRRRELHVIGSRGVLLREALAALARKTVDATAIAPVRCRLEDAPSVVAREHGAARVLVEV